MKGLRIWHPYGTVGGSGLDAPGIARPQPAFSLDMTFAQDVLRAAQGIRTFTEGAEEVAERHLLRSELIRAEQIVFLGFGYLKPNMELLKLGGDGTQATRILGTIYEMPGPSIPIVKNSVIRSFGPAVNQMSIESKIEFHNRQAKAFLWEFGQTLIQ